jgi:CcmD family protein
MNPQIRTHHGVLALLGTTDLLAQQDNPEQRSTEFRAVQGGPEVASGETLLVEAYAAIWIILFGFLFLGWRRQGKIDARIDELEQSLRAARRADERAASAT